jgi:uncharacterized coiled-coil protein SlyX
MLGMAIIEDCMMKRDWLKIAEYSSLIGSTAAIASGSVTSATVPLTLSLVLNLTNRIRSEQYVQNIAYSALDAHRRSIRERKNAESGLERLELIQARDEEFISVLNSAIDSLHAHEARTRDTTAKLETRLIAMESCLSSLIPIFKSDSAQIQTTVADLESQFSTQLTELNQALKDMRSAYNYELILDRCGSRAVLLEALQQARQRLILVCPWLSAYGADSEILQRLEQLLQRDACINIGWGHRTDIDKLVSHSGSLRDRLKSSSDFHYNALSKFESLERKYPKLFKLKLIGTHEKYLVCDRTFAMLGSHNFLTSGSKSAEREIGLKTDDLHVIKELTERFDAAEDLEPAIPAANS